jgi:hypothetical protein
MTLRDNFPNDPMGCMAKCALSTGVVLGIGYLGYGLYSGGKNDEALRQVERLADTNNDGELSAEERSAVYEQLGIEYVPPLVQKLTLNHMREYINSREIKGNSE